MEVWLRLTREARQPGDDVMTALSLAMLRGGVETEEDAHALRAQAIERRREAGERALITWERRVEADGCLVLKLDPACGPLLVEVSAEALERYLRHPQVAAAHTDGSFPAPSTLECGFQGESGCTTRISGPLLHGRYLEDLIRPQLFYEGGYDGDKTLGLLEEPLVFRHHYGVLGASGQEYDYGCEKEGYDPVTDAPPPHAIGGTSGAAPVVSGFAGLFRDWYRDTKGTLIDAPGVLYANLLLMGDRSTAGPDRRERGDDNLTGAGRLRGRRFDATGLDGPYYWGTGRVCVEDGETVSGTIGSPLVADVKALKVVTWRNEAQQDEGADHNKLTLKAQSHLMGGVWIDRETDPSDANDQRVCVEHPTPDKPVDHRSRRRHQLHVLRDRRRTARPLRLPGGGPGPGDRRGPRHRPQ
ncbi:MAG: hypothetical protein JXX28_02075 [Deltaproteobacteria bacterium]|nr:hypothetical protein [Deltaproteobacteria bacterium]